MWRVRIRPADGAFQLLCDGENGRFTTAAPDQLDAQGSPRSENPAGTAAAGLPQTFQIEQ